jgi:RHS repeat-associated protein
VDTGYTGHRDETALGLINMWGRFYDPHIGRFLTPDPFVISPYSSQGLNRYSYVRNNPLSLADPSGFQEDPSIPTIDVEAVVIVITSDESAGGAERGGGNTTNGGPDGSIPGALGSTPETANGGGGDPGMSITGAAGPEQGGGPGSVTIPYFYPLYNVPDKGPQRNALDELQAGLDIASIGLDLTGAGATISWIPDVVNGCISLCRGDKVGASLSLAASLVE